MMDPWFREQFADAHAIVVSDQERAGLDILTTATTTCDEDVAGRSWHHYPLQRWKGLEHEELQTGEDPLAAALATRSGRCSTRSTRRGAGRGSSTRSSTTEEPARVREDLADGAAGGGLRQAGEVRHLLRAGAGLLPRQPHAQVRPRRQEAAHLGHGRGDEQGAAPARATPAARSIQIEEPTLHFMACYYPEMTDAARLPGRLLQPRGRGSRRRRDLDPHLLGQPQHAEGVHATSRTRTRSRSTSSALQGRRVDDRGDRERPQGAAALRAATRTR